MSFTFRAWSLRIHHTCRQDHQYILSQLLLQQGILTLQNLRQQQRNNNRHRHSATPRHGHDRTAETLDEPEHENMEVDDPEEATSSTTGRSTTRMDENMRRVLGGRLPRDPPSVSVSRPRTRTLRIAGVQRHQTSVAGKHDRTETQAQSPMVEPHSSKPRLMSGRVDHPLAPAEPYIRTLE